MGGGSSLVVVAQEPLIAGPGPARAHVTFGCVAVPAMPMSEEVVDLRSLRKLGVRPSA